MEDILIHIGAGHAGENFSVEREMKNLKERGKVNKKYHVLVSDNPNRKFGINDEQKNCSHCYREPMAKELYELLKESGLKDLGMKATLKKPLIYVYIIDKG